MPIGNVNRVRRISTELMTTYKGEFGTDFKQNKKLLNEVAIVRSKGLKNEIAGYITTHLKRELEEQKEKDSLADQAETVSQAEEMEEQLIS
jgi:small subunit ribosomal protein S17e